MRSTRSQLLTAYLVFDLTEAHYRKVIRATRPSFMRVEAHANNIAYYHDSQIHRAEGDKARSHVAPGDGEEALSTGEVKAYFAEQKEDKNLSGLEPSVRKKP